MDADDETIDYRWQGDTAVFVITSGVNDTGTLHEEHLDAVQRPYLKGVKDHAGAYDAMVEHLLILSRSRD